MATGAPERHPYTGPTGPYEKWHRQYFRLNERITTLDTEITRIQNAVDLMGGTGVMGEISATGARISNAMNQISYLEQNKNRLNKFYEEVTLKINNKMTDEELAEVEEINQLFNNKYKSVMDWLILADKSIRDKFLYVYRNSPSTNEKEDTLKCFFNII